MDFVQLGEHIQPNRLRKAMQAKIDETDGSAKQYDAILLLYGLCGNGAVGLVAGRTQIVLPRAHDCCTILLGSKERFLEHFQENPSMPFGSVGYLERGDYFVRTDLDDGQIRYGDRYAALVEQYGEDNAKYIWDSMYPEGEYAANNRVVFIDVPETSELGAEQRFRERAVKEGKEYIRLEGNLQLIRKLLNGDWNAEEFLVVPPGHRTAGVYDWSEIVRAEPAE
jgi:hypothetical protein